MAELTPYELLVEQNIAQNRAVLKSLGLLNSVSPPPRRPVENKPRKPRKSSTPRQVKHENVADTPILYSQGRVNTRRSSALLQSLGCDLSDIEAPRVLEGEHYTPRNKAEPRENTFGEIEGVQVGDWWMTRMECSAVGVHRPTVAGISGRTGEGCYSIALSGGYEDDVDLGECFTYTGSGGRDLKGTKTNPKNLRTAPQSKDQRLEGMNAALADNVENKKPVRVIRGYKLQSPFAPEEGYRYDGLYTVEKWWTCTGLSGFLVYKFALKRLDDQDPPPWITDSADPVTNGYPAIEPAEPEIVRNSLENTKTSRSVSKKYSADAADEADKENVHGSNLKRPAKKSMEIDHENVPRKKEKLSDNDNFYGFETSPQQMIEKSSTNSVPTNILKVDDETVSLEKQRLLENDLFHGFDTSPQQINVPSLKMPNESPVMQVSVSETTVSVKENDNIDSNTSTPVKNVTSPKIEVKMTLQNGYAKNQNDGIYISHDLILNNCDLDGVYRDPEKVVFIRKNSILKYNQEGNNGELKSPLTSPPNSAGKKVVRFSPEVVTNVLEDETNLSANGFEDNKIQTSILKYFCPVNKIVEKQTSKPVYPKSLRGNRLCSLTTISLSPEVKHAPKNKSATDTDYRGSKRKSSLDQIDEDISKKVSKKKTTKRLLAENEHVSRVKTSISPIKPCSVKVTRLTKASIPSRVHELRYCFVSLERLENETQERDCEEVFLGFDETSIKDTILTYSRYQLREKIDDLEREPFCGWETTIEADQLSFGWCRWFRTYLSNLEK